jgi:hypothetical protein
MVSSLTTIASLPSSSPTYNKLLKRLSSQLATGDFTQPFLTVVRFDPKQVLKINDNIVWA